MIRFLAATCLFGLLAASANACDNQPRLGLGLLRRPVAVQKVFAPRQGLLGRRAAAASAASAAPIAQSLTIQAPAPVVVTPQPNAVMQSAAPATGGSAAASAAPGGASAAASK